MEGVASEFAETKVFGIHSVDSNGWTLLHHAASESQHIRMLEVVRGLLEVMPTELVNQKAGGGLPMEWTALSLISNARDPFNERAGIACCWWISGRM